MSAGEKAVVVSQWTGVLALVERELGRAGVRCVTLSGAVPVGARPPLVRALNDPASPVRVMLLSLTAGGVGLNLCGASHLLLLDPHWNPQLEQQAQDRVYRVGQTRHVHVYRFMCRDTVEQSIRRLQQDKLALADSVLTGARATNHAKLSIEDLKVLFNMAA
ncbi:Transcription termination factor 2 [Papilio machaon]|uniref:Transcription termination factor 2 n=1 Tax=Papilio machaon TaxID=76193 RepID=A0A194RHD9_PAPMA|nr:Transcription termination factor 2 [Papilio machaon]